MQEMLQGNENAFVESFRMTRSIFRSLIEELVEYGCLRPSRKVGLNEQLGIFLFFAGQHASSAQLQDRFQLSGETITRHLQSVLVAITKMASTYIQIPSDESQGPKAIYRNSKFYPILEKCRMAVDGTHIPVFVPQDEVAPFQGRKGITMNVLGACDLDLMFTFILAGWEDSAGDGKVYADALSHGFTLPTNLFDIMDAGFALTTKCLTPYRSRNLVEASKPQPTRKNFSISDMPCSKMLSKEFLAS
ncbi:hypothetical protein LEN26_005390 [Aphanomyces euteiches]|nr:hypothetical protein LEN26_005390 [Aphanomyces euteiches]